MDKFLNLVVSGGFLGIVYAFIALGFVFIYKSTKVLNLSQGWLIALFAYLGFLVGDWIPSLPFPAVVVVVLIIAAFVAVGIERFVMRPLVGQPMFASVIVTLAIGFILQAIVMLTTSGYPKTLPVFLPEGVWHLGPVAVTQAYVVAAVFILLIFLACVLFYRRTRMGIALRAVAEDSIIAGTTGISVAVSFRISWIIGCLLATLAGLILGGLYSTVSPDFALYGIGKGLPVILLGGLESIPGALVGGLIVGISEVLAAGYIDELMGGGVREVVPFILMLLILLFRPYGIFGEERIERV